MAYLDNGGKRAMCVWARRSGKDLTLLHQTCKMMHQRVGSYWHVFPTAEQGRKSIWTEFRADGKRIMENVFPTAIRRSPREWYPQAEMVVELKCGSVWRLIGSDKIEVVGAGPVGAVFSEFAVAKPNTWNLVRPMLRQNDGWAAFITTPRGHNHAKRLYDEATADRGWYRDIRTVHDVGQTFASVRRPGKQLTADEMMDEERAEGMPEAMIRQEYLCDWSAANIGAVFGDLVEALEKRGGLEEFTHPKDGVLTVWDLGISDATAIWWFRANGEAVDVLDHYEASGKPWTHFMDVVDSKPYEYLVHWLPHDARQRTGQTGISTVQQFEKRWGTGKVRITPELSVADGIQAARWLLQQPMRIHPRCDEGVEALRQYHYAWDDERKVLSRAPEHDWSSHTADAFRYLACVVRASEFLSRRVDTPRVPGFAPPTLNDVWATVKPSQGRRI
jgi:hypothetical protein